MTSTQQLRSTRPRANRTISTPPACRYTRPPSLATTAGWFVNTTLWQKSGGGAPAAGFFGARRSTPW